MAARFSRVVATHPTADGGKRGINEITSVSKMNIAGFADLEFSSNKYQINSAPPKGGRIMKAFWHYNEYRESGCAMLAPLVLFTNCPTLWSPSGHLMRTANERGISGISPDGFLELLKLGHVRVAARSDWLINGDSRRKSNWEPALFDPNFDGKILRILEDDATSPAPRVIPLQNERGYEIADDEIEKKSDRFEVAKYYYRQGHFPKGTSERIAGLRNIDMSPSEYEVRAIRELIRDAINHDDARRAVNADIPVDDNIEVAISLRSIVGRESSTVPLSDPIVDLERFRQAMQFAAAAAGRETTDGIIELVNNERERDWIINLMNSNLSISSALRTQVVLGNDRSKIADDIVGDRSFEYIGSAFHAGSLIYAAYNIFSRKDVSLSRRMLISGTAAMIGTATNFSAIGKLLERSSSIPEYDYVGPRWHFLLANGKTSPNRTEIDQLCMDLGKLI